MTDIKANKPIVIEDVIYSKDRVNNKLELDTRIFVKVITPFIDILYLRYIKDPYLIYYFLFNALPATSSLFSNLSLLSSLFDFSSGLGSLRLSHITIPPCNISNFFMNYFTYLILRPLYHISNPIFTEWNSYSACLLNTISILF